VTVRLLLASVVGAALLVAAPSDFSRTIAQLSEAGGYFDTDNLISNESSYLEVLPDLQKRGVRGGAYLGVGPDQNFTYIAAVRPSIAFIVDIRRDNELLQLLFKALFQLSRTRIDYLSLLCGRQPPAEIESWRGATIDRLVAQVEKAARSDRPALRARLEQALRGTGVPLSAADLGKIAGFHQRFIDAGPSLRFESTGRPPQGYYPTYRDMLVDKDPTGRQSNFLASEDAFQFVKDLQARDRVIPVVGDLAGPTAVAAIGKLLASRNEKLSAFYTSNVEFYLFREGTFARFVTNLRVLPHAPNAVVIRSIFGRYAYDARRPADDSLSQLQSVDEILSGVASGKIRTYGDLIGSR
jgi:hypothetical protein